MWEDGGPVVNTMDIKVLQKQGITFFTGWVAITCFS